MCCYCNRRMTHGYDLFSVAIPSLEKLWKEEGIIETCHICYTICHFLVCRALFLPSRSDKLAGKFLCMCSCYYCKASSAAALYVILRPLWFHLFCAFVCRNPLQALVTITKSVSFLDSMTLMTCGTFPRRLGSSFHFW